jgi:predicted transcriptional regulator of viral defense system
MLYTYKDLMKRYTNDYQLKKALQRNEIRKVKPGLYSDGDTLFDLPEIFLKRKDTVLTLQSAFQIHEVSDYIPEYTYVSTPRNAYPIRNSDVKQLFISDKYHKIGVQSKIIDDINIRVYDLERSLIELIRYEKKIGFEEYHHVLRKYREKKDHIDFNKLLSYAKHFRSYKKIVNVIQNSIL